MRCLAVCFEVKIALCLVGFMPAALLLHRTRLNNSSSSSSQPASPYWCHAKATD
jgi:hypothetical protein